MQILNIAGYKFLSLSDLPVLQAELTDHCHNLGIKGTILLSPEGINISLAAHPESIRAFQHYLKDDSRFADITFHETYSDLLPFKTLKVRLKDEIITFRQPDAMPTETQRAASIAPEDFKQWLDEGRDITILDTRNDYEVRFGTFAKAVNLHIDDFSELPAVSDKIEKSKPVVMFCTGGIRCEKAAIYLESQGFKDVYQLEGGILGYFAKVGGKHYNGECFVFDKRVAVDSQLHPTQTVQCTNCQGPVTALEQGSPDYIPNHSCPACKLDD